MAGAEQHHLRLMCPAQVEQPAAASAVAHQLVWRA
jgi:hypothetical protein